MPVITSVGAASRVAYGPIHPLSVCNLFGLRLRPPLGVRIASTLSSGRQTSKSAAYGSHSA
jgi:hypothetical protein